MSQKKTIQAILIFSSIAFMAMPALATNETPLSSEATVYVCMSFAQQRKSIESFLLLAEIESRFVRAVSTDNRLAQSCIEVAKVKDEVLVDKLLHSIQEGQNELKVASPARLDLDVDSSFDAVNRSVVYYSASDIGFAENATDQGRRQFSLQVNSPNTDTRKNIFDKPQNGSAKTLTFGFTYFGSTEYMVRRIVDGSDLSLNGTISILLSKIATLMLGDFFLYNPAPSYARSSRYSIREESQSGIPVSTDHSSFLTSTPREAVFFIRLEF